MDSNHRSNFYAKLTEREREVFQLILEGKSNPTVAQNLYIMIGTSKRYTRNILTKLNAGDNGSSPFAGAVVPCKPLPGGDDSAVELSLLCYWSSV